MSGQKPSDGIERIGRRGAPTDAEKALIQTSIHSLDQKLGLELAVRKGIPQGSLILVYYPSETTMPTLFIQRILLNWAKNMENNMVFYVHSTKPLELVLRSFESYNWKYEEYKGKNLIFENMYDMTSTFSTSTKLSRIEVRRRTYIKKIIEKMYYVKENQRKRCFSVFDDLLWMVEDRLDGDHNALILFLKEIIELFTKIGGVHFFLLPQNILDPIAERIIMNAVHGIFYFSREKMGGKIRENFTITKLTGVPHVSEILELTPSETEGFKIESTGKV